MPRTPAEVATMGIERYEREVNFSGGVGTRRTHAIARLELNPRHGAGPIGNGVKRRAKRRAMRAAKREARTLQQRLIRNLGVSGRRVRRAADISVSLSGEGVLTLTQSVVATNITMFFQILRQEIANIQRAYNGAYDRSAKRDTNKEHRRPRIGRLIRAVIGVVMRIVPAGRTIWAAATAVTAVGGPVAAVLDAVLAVLGHVQAAIESALSVCNSRLIVGAQNAMARILSWLQGVRDAYAVLAEGVVGRVEEIQRIIGDPIQTIADIMAGTLIGRVISAASSPVSWALEQLSGWIDENLAAGLELLVERGGLALGALVCGIRDLLSGEVSVLDLIQGSGALDVSLDDVPDSINPLPDSFELDEVNPLDGLALPGAITDGLPFDLPGGEEGPSGQQGLVAREGEVLGSLNGLVAGFIQSQVLSVIRRGSLSLMEFLGAFRGALLSRLVGVVTDLVTRALGANLFARFVNVIVGNLAGRLA